MRWQGQKMAPGSHRHLRAPVLGHRQVTHTFLENCARRWGNSWQEASTLTNHDSSLQALLLKHLLATGSQKHLSDLGYVHELDRSRPARTSPAEQSKHRQAGTGVGAGGEGYAGQQ